MNMKIVSLYDGMSCGMISFKQLGINVDSYDAFEIDKYAIQTSKHNFPEIVHHGDVFKADFTQYKGADFVIGGSPCTFWSIAKKNNRETEASGLGWDLFSQYVRAVKEINPKYFIYENNKSMSETIRQSICEAFGFEQTLINSALVSAQNRQRYYWVGKRNEDGTYSKVDIEQPEDRKILLKDILDSGKDLTSNNKAYTLTASYDGAVAWNTIERHQRNMVAEPVRVGCMPSPDGTLKKFARNENYSTDGKAVNQTAQGGGLGAKTGLYAINIKYCDDKNMKHLMRPFGSKAKILSNTTKKSPTLLAAMGTGGGNGVYYAENPYETTFAIVSQIDSQGKPIFAVSYADNKEYPVYEVISGKITIKGKEYPIKLIDGYYIIRKLTVSECKRLQTVPEWFEFPVSNTQAYKLLGNGWTCEVIMHLIKSCLEG